MAGEGAMMERWRFTRKIWEVGEGEGEGTNENVSNLLPGQGRGQVLCKHRCPSLDPVKLGTAAWHNMQMYLGKASLQEAGHPGKLLVTSKAQNNEHKSVLETGTVGYLKQGGWLLRKHKYWKKGEGS